jgi:SAM-dependent methyltransferase
MRARHPIIPAILGDAHRLPLRDGAVDLVVFVTTLEFLDDPLAALSEAVRVARRGVILVALNRWSAGGLSRRMGAQAGSGLRSQAHDVSLLSLRALAVDAAGVRLAALPWASTLFPGALWAVRGPVPLGDVLGMALVLAEPKREAAPLFSSGRSRSASARPLSPRPCTGSTYRADRAHRWAPDADPSGKAATDPPKSDGRPRRRASTGGAPPRRFSP